MTIDRDLLWKAWPDGYLAMRGVSTVGGWHCVEADSEDKRGALFAQPDASCLTRIAPSGVLRNYGRAPMLDVTAEREAIHRGDLLPNVDPADCATWACLLADLADAFGDPRSLAEDYGQSLCRPPNYGEPWELMGRVNKALPILYGDASWWEWQCEERNYPAYSQATDDPAEALVLARIQVREETGR